MSLQTKSTVRLTQSADGNPTFRNFDRNMFLERLISLERIEH